MSKVPNIIQMVVLVVAAVLLLACDGPAGPPGPPGAPGVSGFEMVHAAGACAVERTQQQSAVCPEGKVAISGGFRIESCKAGEPGGIFMTGFAASQNHPGSVNVDGSPMAAPSEWFVTAWDTADPPTVAEWRLIAYAACATVAAGSG